MIANGRKGSIELVGGRIVVRPLGVFGRKKPEQTISLSAVRQIHFKDAGVMNGFIYVDTGKLPFGSTPAFMASNRDGGLTFGKASQAEFEAIRNEIARRMDQD